jgi:hypothetical protein
VSARWQMYQYLAERKGPTALGNAPSS